MTDIKFYINRQTSLCKKAAKLNKVVRRMEDIIAILNYFETDPKYFISEDCDKKSFGCVTQTFKVFRKTKNVDAIMTLTNKNNEFTFNITSDFNGKYCNIKYYNAKLVDGHIYEELFEGIQAINNRRTSNINRENIKNQITKRYIDGVRQEAEMQPSL